VDKRIVAHWVSLILSHRHAWRAGLSTRGKRVLDMPAESNVFKVASLVSFLPSSPYNGPTLGVSLVRVPTPRDFYVILSLARMITGIDRPLTLHSEFILVGPLFSV
jgi:hypothetical protein